MDVPTSTIPNFPPEMYEKIFSYLKAADFLSVINANPEWNDLLRNKKTIALFPLVLDILTNKQRHLQPADLLPCRLVHTTWKSAIDSTMARNPLQFFSRRYQFFDEPESEAFINHSLLLKDGNPFLGRYLKCSLDNMLLKNVLVRFGSTLETLSLHSRRWNNPATSFPDDLIYRVSSFLSLTPNIRELTLEIRETLLELPAVETVLPPLPKLYKLDISHCLTQFPGSVRVPILETILLLAVGERLTELTCSSSLFLVNGIQYLLPNLRKLIFEKDSLSNCLSNRQLEVLSSFNCKKLETLEFRDYSQKFTPEVATTITNFPLKSLRIGMPSKRQKQQLDAIKGLKELWFESEPWFYGDMYENPLELIPFLSSTFPDLELLTIIGLTRYEGNRESQQPLFVGLKKLNQIRYRDSNDSWGRKFRFTR